MRIYNDNVQLAPTDLSNYLSCHHLTQLDLSVARGEAERPQRYGPVLDELKALGLAHEQAYLAHLDETGASVCRVGDADADPATGADRTLTAMRRCDDYIYQGTLAWEGWSGRADFLMKVDTPSTLGNWSYEVIDTKLARETRGGTILQLCVYSYVLGRLQGIEPAFMHVVTPGADFSPRRYRVNDYGAYFRVLEKSIGQFIRNPQSTYPELVSHCDLCVWWSQCEQRRREDDHLCYVAGIRSHQINALRDVGVETLADLAQLATVPAPGHGSIESLKRVRDQANIQWRGREAGKPLHELLEPFGPDHGLALLPEPTPDDIFLDFEGNHFTEGGVQEYLTGFLHRDGDGGWQYDALWASSLEEERQAFERFMDMAIAMREHNPRAHIYHFAPYEPAALKRLMGRFATREVELDRLLRGKAFVDLHTVVKRSLIASVERYSLKELEPFCGYARMQDLHQASLSRRLVEHCIEAGVVGDHLRQHFDIVEAYNREDCESARWLRDWLEALRAEVITAGQPLPRPELEEGDASEAISELDQSLRRLRDDLLNGVPENPEERDQEARARFILAHMMEFHRREDKAAWWEYFRIKALEQVDYADERRAMSGMSWDALVEDKKAPVHRYHFPAQELDVRVGDGVYNSEGQKIGIVNDVSYSDRTIDIKQNQAAADERPTGVVFFSRVPSDPLRQSLMRLGGSVLAEGFSEQMPYKAGLELLLRNDSPLAAGRGALQRDEETPLDAACRLVAQLDGNVLAIQGPPGTGKTYTGAMMICALKARGLRVGVTAVSHKVIENLLEGVMEEAEKQGLGIHCAHRQEGDYLGPWAIGRETDYDSLRQGLSDGTIDVLGGTAWCWARPGFEQSVDVLVVDEAGQMSLSNVLAVCPAGRSLVLLGDPQQLEQPLQSSHPEGSEVSALAHLLDGHQTMPPSKGLFLAETFRLHPDIARFTSEVYYESKVASRPGLENQAVVASSQGAARFQGSGLRYVPVTHTGNQSRSLEEVAVIRQIVDELLAGAEWKNKDSQVVELTGDDILIIAPYNAQVAALKEALPAQSERIGTVDKFQGQQAPVVIYSMTSSSPEDAPRGMSFLYDRHRFNVATSRAKAMCIVVGSPALFEPECQTPPQMLMANGFCYYLEVAQLVKM